MQEFEFEELEEATESFSQSRLIGKGSHGNVYKGILKDGHQVVAIKKQSLGLQKLQDNSKIENEAQILSSLAQNPNLINLLGISHDSSSNKVLVMEFMPNGTLHELLHGTSNPPLTWPKRTQIAIQIAKAVQFLHEAEPNSIIHRDIKSTNILFDADCNAKVADLGLATQMNDDPKAESLIPPAGTIGYLDPCYTVPGKLSTKIDVFSFGVLLFEIISGTKVIDVSRSPSSIVEWAIPLLQKDRKFDICDKRVDLSRSIEGTAINSMLSIASRCVLSREEKRPSMRDIVIELENCIVVEPAITRFPVWMNYVLQSFILLKRQRKTNGAKKHNFSSASAAIVCEAYQINGHVGVPRGKLLLREILADIS